MVAQHLLPPRAASEQTLDEVWRSTAERVSLRGAVLLLAVGLGGVTVRAVTGRLTILASLGILAIAFACYSMLIRSLGAQRGRLPRMRRIIAALMATVATVAGLATALLILAALFGSSLEVMRH